MSFDPYLHFQGNCAEAMAWYAEVFGATDLVLMRYNQAPDMPPAMAGSDKVMHAALTVNGRVLMASDYPPGMPGETQKAVSLSHAVPSVAAGQAIYDRLAQGGEAIMPFGETFWAEGFGMLRDRFGTHWMINGPQKPM